MVNLYLDDNEFEKLLDDIKKEDRYKISMVTIEDIYFYRNSHLSGDSKDYYIEHKPNKS